MSRITPWTVIAMFSCLQLSGSYKILVVFPFYSASHGILGDGVVRHILAAGHQVTYITPFPKNTSNPNLHEVFVENQKSLLPNFLNIKRLMDNKDNLNDQSLVFNMMLNMAEMTLEHSNVQNLIEDPNQKFDLVIAEWMFTEVYCGLSIVFDCPCAMFFPFENSNVVLRLIDEVPNPAYTPTIFSSSVTPFSFQQRVEGLWTLIASETRKKFQHIPVESELYEKSFGKNVQKKGRVLPPFEEMRHNIALALVNSHVSLSTAIRAPQNYISIGGYHINSDIKPLPEDLKKIMDTAKHGVIYFSMGSNLQSKDMPDELKKSLLKIFGGLKQTVLWKFEEILPGLPKNVHILKWAPQPSILAHPNCVLFITHGGLLSAAETIHFGVPIIGIPVFADQFINVDKAVAKGFAKRVDLSYTMADELAASIEDIISDPKYSKMAKELSLIYHDRPVPPGKELVHWVEHVVRTRGAPHLRSPALMLPWYQKAYLDLAAVLVLVMFVIVIMFKWLFSTVLRGYVQMNVDSIKKTK